MTSESVTGSPLPCFYLYKRQCLTLSAKSTLPISITELCQKLLPQEARYTHLLEVIKTGTIIRLPFKFNVCFSYQNFCLNCQKNEIWQAHVANLTNDPQFL